MLLARIFRIVSKFIPSGFRALIVRERLRKKFGFYLVGDDQDYQILRTSFGRQCRINSPIFIVKSYVGDFSYIEPYCRISDTEIGKYCAIAPFSLIGLVEHPTRKFVSIHPIFYRHIPEFGYDFVDKDKHQEIARTYIGNDVWVGAGACIKGGITVGDGAVIGAGAVVTKNVPAYAVVGGSPARVIRYRFDKDTIDFLKRLRWWDQEERWIRENLHCFHDIEVLKSVAGSTIRLKSPLKV